MYKTVSVLGLGYIGLPTALLMAKAGLIVHGFDVDANRVTLLSQGELPFQEHGLSDLFASVRKTKRFHPTETLIKADAYLIAVPTPHKKNTADLTYVLKALELIRPVFKKNNTIIIESTIGPRDCESVIIPYIDSWNVSYVFAHCPERAIPGSTLYEMVHNDRIIGGRSRKEADKVTALYKRFVKGQVYTTTATIAASVKVMENTYRAINIALANEYAQIAAEIGFDVWEAIDLANKHPRVNIHYPGPGVGGHCIPIDPWFFVQDMPKGLIKTALTANKRMPEYVAEQVRQKIKKHRLKRPTIGLLGYAYKKNVDDVRETPAEKLYSLLKDTYNVVITDPHCEKMLRQRGLPVLPIKQLLEAVDALVVVTDHDAFKSIRFKKYPNVSFIFDTRNIIDATHIAGSKTALYRLGAE